MPILGEEANIYPNTLLEVGGAPQDAPFLGETETAIRQWWVVHTKPRQEKSLARELFAQKTPFYLPLVKKNSIVRRRRLTSHVPLFASYLFMFASEQERVRSLTSNRVLQTLTVHSPENLEFDLRQIQRLIAANVPLTPEARLGAGTRVRVRSGPLAGLEGIVLRRRDATRLVVSVNFLQQGASAEVEDFILEQIT
jgi:transcriptional antiterminator RfaH